MESTDLFNPTQSRKDLAISRAISQSVTAWAEGDMDQAEHMLDVAKEFVDAPLELFNP